jgi:hypothetical protein
MWAVLVFTSFAAYQVKVDIVINQQGVIRQIRQCADGVQGGPGVAVIAVDKQKIDLPFSLHRFAHVGRTDAPVRVIIAWEFVVGQAHQIPGLPFRGEVAIGEVLKGKKVFGVGQQIQRLENNGRGDTGRCADFRHATG